MINGIYHVKFSSSNHVFGEGLAFVNSEAVNGGDHGYLYLGRIASNGGSLSGRLQIRRWNSAVASVFGALQSFDLDLTGTQNASDRSFQVAGNVSGHPAQRITISGRFLSELA